MIRWTLLLLLLILAVPHHSFGQELTYSYGTTQVQNTPDHDKNWQVDFRYKFSQYLAASTSYLNEGHFPAHKRDGVMTQAWGSLPLFRRKVSVDIGVGAYRFSDTQPRPGGSYADMNDWAAVYTISGTYYLDSPWFFRVTGNKINAGHDADSTTYALGIGYRLWKGDPETCPVPATDSCPSPSRTTGDEIMPFIGRTVVNSLEDQKGVAAGIEFRKGIADNVDVTVTWLNEGNPDVIRRDGIAAQLWLVDTFYNRRMTLGIGAGGYFYLDKKDPTGSQSRINSDLAGLISLTTSYRFAERWFTRVIWNRVVTNYNRDTDVFVLGVGYRWEE